MTLAIKGGEKTVTLKYPPHPWVGEEERNAVNRVFTRNQFSQFIASAGRAFLGGQEVQLFENEVARTADCEFGVAYNSWTSGLHAAVAACLDGQPHNLGRGVFTTPYTFTSSATCALMNNCVPIFVDVDPITCNITPESLEKAAIEHPSVRILVLVHLFGLPADMDGIMRVAEEYDIQVIEDAAQAPGALYKGKAIGSLGICGGFSFTQSKAVNCGEGGVLVTNDDATARAARMVRNHGEAVTDGDRTYNSEVLGMGYRMTELAAAIGREQWKKLPAVNDWRIKLNQRFQTAIREMCDFIEFQLPNYDAKHVYYTTAMLFDKERAGVDRDQFCDAVIAEGVPLFKGYVKPLYLQTLYQQRQHLALLERTDISYDKGLCPVAEELHEKRLFFTMVLRPPMGDELLEQVINAFKKVVDNLDALKEK